MASSVSSVRKVEDSELRPAGQAIEKEPAMGPMQTLLDVLAGPWTLFLAWTLLQEGPLRFGELHRQTSGISSKVLTERLRMLERRGFVHRRYEPFVPPQVSYEATSKLRELTPILTAFRDLAERWSEEKRTASTN